VSQVRKSAAARKIDDNLGRFFWMHGISSASKPLFLQWAHSSKQINNKALAGKLHEKIQGRIENRYHLNTSSNTTS
jgi:hypothetical protein